MAAPAPATGPAPTAAPDPANGAAQAMDRDRARAIAAGFAPGHVFGSRRDYYYSRAKLGTDPVYPGVCAALRGSRSPLLDLGCGLGLLAHALRADGIDLPYRGVDVDVGKIERARRAADRRGLTGVAFEALDLARALPAHRGSVALLDVLQFIPPEAQDRVLTAAVAMLTPGARLVIRTGLDDGGGRARVTRSVDVLSRMLGWMNAAPDRYPDADALRARFAAAGLQAEFTPLYGRTPFNNWRVLAWRPDAATPGGAAAD